MTGGCFVEKFKTHQPAPDADGRLDELGLLCCPICGERLDVSELHLGIVFCRTCESNNRSFDIDTGNEETTRKLLSKLAI